MNLYRKCSTVMVKPGGRLVRHARYHWLRLVEGHLTRGARGGSGHCLHRWGKSWRLAGAKIGERKKEGNSGPGKGGIARFLWCW